MASGDITRSKDLRGRSTEELGNFLKDKEAELLKLKFQMATGQLENTARVTHVKREIARAQTILVEKTRDLKRLAGRKKASS